MTPRVLRAALTEQPIVLAEHEELVGHQAAGAIVGFVGMIRDHDGQRPVLRLEYSAHPSAERVMAEVLAEVAEQSHGVRAIAASHRIGVLQIGEAALVAAVAADHRREAFDTCALLVDTIKARLPVWKHQFFADGTDEWVGSA
ncbi:molybdenum cofactor biosynthesis protein MoaE [Mycobacterium shimoidei]|jgi:molybdopterin synthase catalytic subunit|uniref:Putative molybdenum cofactor biosynthesis protein E2 MoaE2 (Molybdopterin converting factor large subunit) (Molybdopterin [MPT] converting factor, subunit 2) [Mycobacterium tuberculosis H37Rv] n=1 Tax=Mycobacterium shimoidei TaxID=29313 RepID=A0A1E3TEE8_MYCSH|nr:molybdenum cofactor biosynthesis protein MoaE [Mycobacterium shimoidei]MCV7258426.1 molybdenum cofactor biosynthesis protein MoaE [Mycobacterium shimoidei]ODR12673.1 molybdenum cofactor biosynthesis protein MoaE [Mycobacterium shimoidei]ORW81779.1 molybdenum cofactor biosynthesis protein MoaE [Mycobacterium shimoidei]SRX93770.1 putative molybdenum cofactor biosynthesis protein E2 MoaE2 (molybdopterin converting factor large subunit) (molybdopterin [MPT] converting factor, subunit 2) [Mycobac